MAKIVEAMSAVTAKAAMTSEIARDFMPLLELNI